MSQRYKSVESVGLACSAKIPAKAISKRAGPGGRSLDYLETNYVSQLLNNIFGPHGWDLKADINHILEAEQDGKFHVVYRSKVTLTMTCEANHTQMSFVRESHGFGQARSRNLADAHELAGKEAESDALKRAARHVGDALGNALYFDHREGVEAEERLFEKIKTTCNKDLAQAKELARKAWKTQKLNDSERDQLVELFGRKSA